MEGLSNSEVGPVVVPERRDYGAASMRKGEIKAGERIKVKG